MKQLSQETVDALRAVSQAIEIDPKGFHMGTWATDDLCQTTLCIAGHLALLRGYTPVMDQETPGKCVLGYFKSVRYVSRFFGLFGAPKEVGSSIGDLIEEEYGLDYEQRSLLFYVHNWPERQQHMYHNGYCVQAAQQVIEMFIAKYGPKKESEVLRKQVTERGVEVGTGELVNKGGK